METLFKSGKSSSVGRILSPCVGVVDSLPSESDCTGRMNLLPLI